MADDGSADWPPTPTTKEEASEEDIERTVKKLESGWEIGGYDSDDDIEDARNVLEEAIEKERKRAIYQNVSTALWSFREAANPELDEEGLVIHCGRYLDLGMENRVFTWDNIFAHADTYVSSRSLESQKLKSIATKLRELADKIDELSEDEDYK